jgi:predicted nuclease of predicted toxin-antitoxin system
LAAEYPGSDHVALLGMAEASDREIWEHAGAAGFMVVSKDSDFRQLAFLYGPPPKVLWLSVGNVSTAVIEELLRVSALPVAEFAARPDEAFLELRRAS